MRLDYLLIAGIVILSIILLYLLICGGKKKPPSPHRQQNLPPPTTVQPKVEVPALDYRALSSQSSRIDERIKRLKDTLLGSSLAHGAPSDANPAGILTLIVMQLNSLELSGAANRISQAVQNIQDDIIVLRGAYDQGKALADDTDQAVEAQFSLLRLQLQLAETAYADENEYVRRAKKLRLVYSK